MMLILYIADSVPFGESCSMEHTMNLKLYFCIAIIIAEATKLTIIIGFQHIAYMLTESYIKMTRKLEVNKSVHEPCHAINKQSVKLETITI